MLSNTISSSHGGSGRRLKILIYSPAFHPLVGGLEAVVEMLAAELGHLGHDVTVATTTSYDGQDSFNFSVLRNPKWSLVKVVRDCDVYIHANVSLWGFLPLLLAPTPWIAIHQGWYEVLGQPVRTLDRVKRWLTRHASSNISASHAIDEFLALKGHVIPNPYDKDVFKLHHDVSRDRDLIFVGRLVSDKGVDILVDALALLRSRNLRPQLTIVGSGPELPLLRSLVQTKQLTDQVQFAGLVQGQALARLMNAHHVMVVPSRWNEPFGVVALEGIACGCMLVGSEGGGLIEAIGPCGLTYPNQDATELANRIETALTDAAVRQSCLAAANDHLSKHDKRQLAKDYLAVILQVLPE